MRLLLDEHLDKAIAEELRRRGYDVTAVTERPDLRGRPDPNLLDIANGEERAIATRDARDFIPLAAELMTIGAPFAGLILIPKRSFPPEERGHGRLIRALAAILAEHPTRSSLRGRTIWLSAADAEPDKS